MKNKAPELKLKIKINGEEVDNFYGEFEKRYKKAMYLMKKNPPGSDLWVKGAKDAVAYGRAVKKNREEQKAFMDSLKSDSDIMNEFKESFMALYSGIRTGDLAKTQAGFEGITSGIKGATKAAIRFVATPVGAILAVLSGVGLVAKEFIRYNEAIKESVILTERISSLSGEHSNKVRLHSETMAKVFNSDQKKILETAKGLVNEYKISWNEAMSEIEKGFIEGQGVNEEYLDSLGEYDAFFAKAKFSVSEFRKVISTGYDLGIYKDKLPDAIKEFTLAISDQTAAARDALEEAFGYEYTKQLFDGVKNGSITIKDALLDIEKQSKKMGLSINQQQKLTADLFKAAGEDAGGALKIFKAINSALDNQDKVLTPLQAIMKETTEAHHELAEAKDKALRSEDYIAFSGEVSIAWTKVKTSFYNTIAFIREKMTAFAQWQIVKLGGIIAMVKAFPVVIRESYTQIKSDTLVLMNSLVSLGDVFSRFLRLDFEGAKAAASEYAGDVSKKWDNLKGSANGVWDSLKKVREEAEKEVSLNLDKRKQSFIDADKIEQENKLLEESAAKRRQQTTKDIELIKKRLEAERKYRETVLNSNKDLYEQERIAYQQRLKEAGIYEKKKTDLSKEQLQVAEILKIEHETKIADLENEAINRYLDNLKKKYEHEKLLRATASNNEIAEIQTVEEAKELLKDSMSEKELSKIKTLHEAKEYLQRQHESRELEKQATYLQKQLEVLTAAMQGQDTGINLADKLLTEEQKVLLQERLDQVKKSMSDIGLVQSEESPEEEDSMMSEVDFFGFSADQWESTFSNLDTAKGKIAAVEMVVAGMQQAWGMYSDFMATNEKKDIDRFKKNNDKKKKELKKKLDAGLIDQATYNKEVEKMDKDLEKKKAKAEHNQAKRQRTSALLGIASQTALGIMKAAAESPLTFGMPWTALIAAMGAVQAGLVLQSPLPGYAQGGYTSGLGYRDETGHEVAGTVHANEYVIPEYVLNSSDPNIPVIMEYVEASRQRKYPRTLTDNDTVTKPPVFKNDNTDSSKDQMYFILAQAINKLVDEGVYSIIGDDQLETMQARIDLLKRNRDNAKI